MTLWGGRFSDAPDDSVWTFTASPTDRRLLAVDVAGSVAHVTALGSAGILPPAEVTEILSGLESIADEVEAGGFEFAETDEDVHTAVERRLTELVGPVAGKLHTGRSRNDQIALDIRLYLLDSVARLDTAVAGLMNALFRPTPTCSTPKRFRSPTICWLTPGRCRAIVSDSTIYSGD